MGSCTAPLEASAGRRARARPCSLGRRARAAAQTGRRDAARAPSAAMARCDSAIALAVRAEPLAPARRVRRMAEPQHGARSPRWKPTPVGAQREQAARASLARCQRPLEPQPVQALDSLRALARQGRGAPLSSRASADSAGRTSSHADEAEVGRKPASVAIDDRQGATTTSRPPPEHASSARDERCAASGTLRQSATAGSHRADCVRGSVERIGAQLGLDRTSRARCATALASTASSAVSQKTGQSAWSCEGSLRAKAARRIVSRRSLLREFWASCRGAAVALCFFGGLHVCFHGHRRPPKLLRLLTRIERR